MSIACQRHPMNHLLIALHVAALVIILFANNNVSAFVGPVAFAGQRSPTGLFESTSGKTEPVLEKKLTTPQIIQGIELEAASPPSMLDRLQDEANPCCTKKTKVARTFKLSRVNTLAISIAVALVGGYVTLSDVFAQR